MDTYPTVWEEIDASRQDSASSSSSNLWKHEGIVATLWLEARVAGLLSRLHPSEEGRERFVDSTQHVLEHLRVHDIRVWTITPHGWQLCALLLERNGLARRAPSVTALLNSGIVQLATQTANAVQC